MRDKPEISPVTRAVLSHAGWSGANVPDAVVEAWIRELRPGFRVFAQARLALGKFGGLRIEQSGTGEECARETFDLRPTLALYEEDRFERFASSLGSPLFPLGEAGNGHVFLAISPDGRVFALMEDLWLVGQTIEAALDNLVAGKSSTKLDIGPFG